MRPRHTIHLGDGPSGLPFMKFTLTYDGPLPASANSRKPEDKWRMRCHFHPQLIELTKENKALTYAIENSKIPKNEKFIFMQGHHLANPGIGVGGSAKVHKDEKWDLFETKPRGGKHFLPIVRESMGLTCTLDILFLRKEDPGALILQGGDIDGRIKTLFDALRMPWDDTEATHKRPENIPEPFYCLLESDSLITGVNIKTDRLLTAPNAANNEVRLVIAVDVRVMHARAYNMSFLAD